MIVSLMILFIAFLAIFQDDKRRLTALIFAFLTLTHEVFFQEVPGVYYYFSAAIIDCIIIEFILKLKYSTKLTENLFRVSLLFIAWNAAGWVMWEKSLPEEIYVVGAAILYMCAIVSLLNWDGIEDGNYKINRWANIFRMPDNPCDSHVSGLPKEG